MKILTWDTLTSFEFHVFGKYFCHYSFVKYFQMIESRLNKPIFCWRTLLYSTFIKWLLLDMNVIFLHVGWGGGGLKKGPNHACVLNVGSLGTLSIRRCWWSWRKWRMIRIQRWGHLTSERTTWQSWQNHQRLFRNLYRRDTVSLLPFLQVFWYAHLQIYQ